MCVRERERERERKVCVCESERERERKCVCESERERERKCVCESEREREKERMLFKLRKLAELQQRLTESIISLLFMRSLCFWYASVPDLSVERRPASTAATPIIPSWYTCTEKVRKSIEKVKFWVSNFCGLVLVKIFPQNKN